MADLRPYGEPVGARPVGDTAGRAATVVAPDSWRGPISSAASAFLGAETLAAFSGRSVFAETTLTFSGIIVVADITGKWIGRMIPNNGPWSKTWVRRLTGVGLATGLAWGGTMLMRRRPYNLWMTSGFAILSIGVGSLVESFVDETIFDMARDITNSPVQV